MKKLFLTGIFILGMNIMMNAQTMKFPATVMFTSECCGVPTDSSILKMIQHFKNNITLKPLVGIILVHWEEKENTIWHSHLLN